MKKWLKLFAVGTLAVCLCLSMFACNGNKKGLVEGTEWKDDASKVSRNKELAHSPLISYDSLEDAIKGDAEKSAHYLSLNGDWAFKLVTDTESIPAEFMNTDFDNSSWDKIKVPGNWETQGFSKPDYAHDDYVWDTTKVTAPKIPDENEIGLYSRTIDVPADWDGQEIYISFKGVESACYVYVNGAMCGYGEDSYTSKDFRITPYIVPGKTNTISVKVFKYCDGSWLEAQDTLKMGGIYRDVYLYSAPKTQIKDISVSSSVKFSNGKFDGEALLYLGADIATYGEKKDGYYVEFSLYGPDGKAVVKDVRYGADAAFSEKKTGGANLASVDGRVIVDGVKLWSAENPVLYTSVFTLKNSSGKVINTVSERIGIRDASFASDENGKQTFTVNSVPVSIYGVTYYEMSAVNGKALTREEMISDIKKMKELNINAVRSPGAPLSDEFIKLCDEYGLYVISDINLETDPWSSKAEQSIPGNQGIWQPAILDRLSNVLMRDKNCPSVILWSLGNQSGQGSVMTNVKTYLTANDSRYIIYDAYLDVDNGEYTNQSYVTEADIISATNWSLDKLNDVLTNKDITKPVIIQDFDSALLSSAGSVENLVKYINDDSKVQGCIFGNWSDKAIYVPKDKKNAVKVCRETPYNDKNANLYQLEYASSWDSYSDDGEAIAVSKYSLNGILNADRSVQSDALELKNAYAQIYVEPIDIASGKFNITNRHCFTSVNDKNIVVSYQVTDGTKVVKEGNVTGIKLAPGESKELVLDYGTVPSGDAFVTVTVSYAKAPSWATKGFDKIISSVQYDINNNTKPVKNGSSTEISGPAFVLDSFRAPIVNSINTDVANGIFYITNPSSEPFDSLYKLDYMVVETNNFCNDPKPVVYASGSVNTGIGAYAEGAKVQLPYHVNAVDEGTYEVVIVLTAKKDIGSVKAGYSVPFSFTSSSLGMAIPFQVDASRTPEGVYDPATGEQVIDEKGNRVWVNGDPGLTEYTDSTVYYESPETPNVFPKSYIKLTNDIVTIEINPDTGLIEAFKVDGKDVFAKPDGENGILASTIGSLFRTPTGGDYTADFANDAELLKKLSSDATAKKLLDIVALNKIDDNHYRMSVMYSLPSVDGGKTSLSKSNNSIYNIVYDFYANGVINVSVAYDLNPSLGIPTALSNIITLSGDYKNVEWYGRGPGETYSDKLYNSTVGIFKDNVNNILPNYLLSSGGDRSQTRWAAFTDDAGNGVVITSDTNNLTFNASKQYPWENFSYASSTDKRNCTVVSIAGSQMGCTPGTIADQAHFETVKAIDGGSYHTFSYRIVPVTAAKTEDFKAESARTLSSAGTAEIAHNPIISGVNYSIQGLASGEFITIDNDKLLVQSAMGSDSQRFQIETVPEGILIKSLQNNLYMTAVGLSATKRESVEIGFAPLDLEKYPWQAWQYSDNRIIPSGMEYSLTSMATAEFVGSRIALSNVVVNATSAWTMNYDVNQSDIATIKNNKSGLYLTYFDDVSYADAVLHAYDIREFSFAPDTDWNKYQTSEQIEFNNSRFTPTTGRVTQWPLLPATQQTWTFIADGSGYKLYNVKTGQYLGVRQNEEGSYNLVLFDPMNKDEDPASLSWKVEYVDGNYAIINADTGLVLQSKLVRTKLTQAEMDRDFITDVEVAFKNTYVLELGVWNNNSNQKWNLASDEDRKVSIELGTDWYVNGIEKIK